MDSHAAWLAKHTKSVLADVTITLDCSKMSCYSNIPVTLHMKAVELDYGPVIDVHFTVDVPMKEYELWDDHPFRALATVGKDATGKMDYGDIIDDTPAVRAIIKEITEPARKLYTTTHTTHIAALIASLHLFWS